MKKIILLAFCFLVLFSVPVIAAQAEGETVYDPAVVELILVGIGGLTVVGLTQLIKTWLKATGLFCHRNLCGRKRTWNICLSGTS